MKTLIKMNTGNILSLGNLFKEIKDLSKNSNNINQQDLFCTLFNIENVNNTTINNYLVGNRKIGNDYKQTYLNYKKKYLKDNNIFVNIINDLLNLIEGNIIYNIDINYINNNETFIKLTNNLYRISKLDKNINKDFINNINDLIIKKDYYNSFINMLFYIILENKQPLYESDLIKEKINNILDTTTISINDLSDILEIELHEGLSYNRKLVELASLGNPYAMYKLAYKEYLGEISGKKNLNKCINYLKEAIKYNHPASYYLLAKLIYNKELGNLSNEDIKIMHEYLNKAINLGSTASVNLLGLCYMNGITLNKQKDLNKAKELFEKAISYNYVYSYNNLAKLYEKIDFNKTIELFTISSNLNESYACNYLGEYYRKNNDFDKAFFYYTKGSNSSIKELYPWNNINLVKYFYLNGNTNILISKDLNKCKELLEVIKDNIEAKELLLKVYKELNISNLNDEIDILLTKLKDSK